MISLSKRKKHPKGLKDTQCEDRITALPSCLISKILSCLTTKEAVATSVLSTKWKRSWTSITSLDFDDEFSRYDFEIDKNTPNFWKFTTFVSRVLLLRERSCLQSCRFNCCCVYDDSLIKAWITAVLQCNVKELDISICMKDRGLLPSDVFICSTLVVLKLDVCGLAVKMPSSACLPNLRSLHIDEVEFVDDAAITNLLIGCPVLEELILRNVGKNVRVVNIIAHALKKLFIEDLLLYEIMIDTPALEYFYLSDYVENTHVVNMDHLVKADINIEFVFGIDYAKAIEDFLNGISNAENLVFSYNSMLVISSSELALPKFSNLIYLKLHVAGDPGWIVLAKFLQNSHHLETLHITQGDGDFPKEAGPGTLPFDAVPSCFLFHLKEIYIGTFQFDEDDKDEMEVVEYILKNAEVLETLTLDYCPYSRKVDAIFFKELLSLPRASTKCKVVVCSND